MRSQGIAVKSPDGKVEKIIIVSREITEGVEAAEKLKVLELQLFQAEKLNSPGKIISGVAHELNNPPAPSVPKQPGPLFCFAMPTKSDWPSLPASINCFSSRGWST